MSQVVENRGSLISVPLALRAVIDDINIGSSQTWLFQTWLFAIFTRKRSLALFCGLAFTLFCGHFCVFCAHLRVSAFDHV